MLGKSRNAVIFQWFMIPDVRKVCSLKRRVRKQLFGREMQNGTPLWREARFQVKMYKRPHSRSNFRSPDLKKHPAVARSTFSIQNVKKLTGTGQFWTFRCPKMARRCGAKHICNSKCAKHLSFGAILELPISKNCTPLWREAHFQFKTLKKLTGSGQFWTFRCPKMARRCGAKHVCKAKSTKHLHFRTLLDLQTWKRFPTEEIDRFILIQACINQSVSQSIT